MNWFMTNNNLAVNLDLIMRVDFTVERSTGIVEEARLLFDASHCGFATIIIVGEEARALYLEIEGHAPERNKVTQLTVQRSAERNDHGEETRAEGQPAVSHRLPLSARAHVGQ